MSFKYVNPRNSLKDQNDIEDILIVLIVHQFQHSELQREIYVHRAFRLM